MRKDKDMRQKETRRVKNKALRFLLTVSVTILAVLLVFCILRVIVHRYQNVTGNPVTMSATINSDGFWELTWTPFDDASQYAVTVTDEHGLAVFQNTDQVGEQIVLDTDIPPGDYIISVNRKTGNLISIKQAYTEKVTLADLTVNKGEVYFSPEEKSLSVTWISDADTFTLYDLTDGASVLYSDIDTSNAEIFFGEGKAIDVPNADEEKIIGISAVKKYGSCYVYGLPHELVTVRRGDLHGTELNLSYTIDSKNAVTFSWDETKGNSYELSVDVLGNCRPVFSAPIDQTTHTTKALNANSSFKFVLRAYDGNKNVIGEDSVEFHTGMSPINATIWPNRSLPVCADTGMSEQLGTVSAASMYCVLDEDTEKNLFKIRYAEDVYGWIDSNYCMINLPEYIGTLCSYDITNSYNSLCTFHEYEITGLTGSVVSGYETVQMDDGSFLVPLLYPTCQKLIQASQTALDMGYRLRLYDAYRPRVATNRMYGIAASALYRPIPFKTYTGNAVSLPNMGDDAREQLILLDFVQNSGWDLSSFLAFGSSCHNNGIAIDLALEDSTTGEILPSQTMMHDLSVFSTTYANTENSKTLFNIMDRAGFTPNLSEWWHFEDSDAQSLNLDWCNNGICIRGWTFDGIGWRYRDEAGRYVTSSITDGDKTYSFDGDGYLKE